MGLTAGKIPKAASTDHIIDGYDPTTSIGTPGVDSSVPTEKAVRTELDLKADLLHATNHTDGTDDIQDATGAQKGLATATQIAKLNGIETLADVTDATNVAAAGAVMSTLADAKGDILAATGDNTLARLPVGNNDQILSANSVPSTGVKWVDDEVELWFSPGQDNASILNIVYSSVAALGGTRRIFFHAPFNFKSLVSAALIIAPGNTNPVADLDLFLSYGTIGETMLQHSASDITSTYNLVVNTNFAVPITALLGSLAANDFISVQIVNNEASLLYLFGLRFRYIKTKP